MSFLVSGDYIDEEATLSADGIGEGELFDFYCDVTVDGSPCKMNVQMNRRKEAFRVFRITIKDTESNTVNKFEVSIDRETAAVSLFEE